MTFLEDVKKRKFISQDIYSETFLVTDKKNQRFMAQVLYQYYDDYDKPSRYSLERTLCLNCHYTHPAILKGYDYSISGFGKEQRPTILYEYCPNGTLENCIQQLDNTKKLINLFGIASGMNLLHQDNVLHRELKSSNVLEDANYNPKIININFSGTVKSLEQIAKIHKLPQHIAPETLMESEYTKSSEVYAYGVLAYEILTNKKPFDDMTQFQRMQKITNGERPEIPDNFLETVKKLIEDCWDQDPKKRPTFEEICKILRDPF